MDNSPDETFHETSGPGSLNRDQLKAYLNHHLLGSRSGVRMFRTAADTWKGTPYEQRLLDLTEKVSALQDRLLELIDELGLKQSVVEKVAATPAELAGRLNPVNANRSTAQGMTQVELDLLQSALQGQAGMWEVLARLAEVFPHAGLDRQQMTAHQQSTLDLQAEVKAISAETLDSRFVAD